MATKKGLLQDKDTVILTKKLNPKKRPITVILNKKFNLKIQKIFYSRLKRKIPYNKKIPKLYLKKELLPLLQGLIKFKN